MEDTEGKNEKGKETEPVNLGGLCGGKSQGGEKKKKVDSN